MSVSIKITLPIFEKAKAVFREIVVFPSPEYVEDINIDLFFWNLATISVLKVRIDSENSEFISSKNI